MSCHKPFLGRNENWNKMFPMSKCSSYCRFQANQNGPQCSCAFCLRIVYYSKNYLFVWIQLLIRCSNTLHKQLVIWGGKWWGIALEMPISVLQDIGFQYQKYWYPCFRVSDLAFALEMRISVLQDIGFNVVSEGLIPVLQGFQILQYIRLIDNSIVSG